MVKEVMMSCFVVSNAIVKTWPSGSLSDFTRSIMVIIRLVFGVCFGGRRNQKPIPRQSFYQSASNIAPQNTPREKQLLSNPVQDLIGFDSLLDASISGNLVPLEQKQAIENEFHKPQNTFSVSGKLEELIQTNISNFRSETSVVDTPKCLNELKLNQQLKMD